MAGVALEVVAAQRNLVAHELIAELECVEPVSADRTVAQAYDDPAKDAFELVLQLVEFVQRMGMLDLLADGEELGREFAGPLRRPDTSCRCTYP